MGQAQTLDQLLPPQERAEELRNKITILRSEPESEERDSQIAKLQAQLDREMEMYVRRAIKPTHRYDDLTVEEVYNKHSQYLCNCASFLLAKQGRHLEIDEHNKKVLRFLLYYFNNCEKALEVFPDKNYTLHKNIMLCGTVGVGKTFIMEAIALYLKETNNPMAFQNVSATQMLNYYKQHNHIDLYTYNLDGTNSFEGRPFSICLNDVGMDTQKFYGNDTQCMFDEFFHARNEIWAGQGIFAHITTNLGVNGMSEKFADEFGRLTDRFKTYNVIHLGGKSRR